MSTPFGNRAAHLSFVQGNTPALVLVIAGFLNGSTELTSSGFPLDNGAFQLEKRC